jgi:iron complex outermembrane receptor protein
MKKLSLYAVSALVGMSSVSAHAQSIDYDMLEGLFGEKVTASATGKPQRVSEAPVDMIIIGQDEIVKSGAQDIPQLLQKYAGMSVVRSLKHQADVNVRGYNSSYSNRMLVLVNGRQVYQDSYGFTNWNMLPVQLSEIRQVEVVKGPNTSLFGLNAESGVVNIITYSPLKDDIKEVEVKYGTENTQEGIAILTSKPTDDFAVRMSVAGKSSDMYELDSHLQEAGWDVDEGISKHTYNLDAEYQVDDSTNLRVQAGEVAGESSEVLPYMFAFSDVDKRNRYLQATLAKDTNLGLMKLNAYHNDSTFETSTFKYKNILDVLQAENIYRVDKDNTVRGGVEYRKSTLSGQAVAGGEFKSELFGISGMWDHVVNDKLTVTNSARFDHMTTEKSSSQSVGDAYSKDRFDQTFDAISFNSGAIYKLNDLESIRVNAGRGIHLPSLIELGADNDSVVDFAGNPNLEPEIMWSAEVGYTRLLPEVQGKFKSTVFYQYIEDYIAKTITSAVPMTSDAILAAENAGKSESVGLELSYDAKLNENVGYGSSYTFTYTKDHPDEDNAIFEEQNNNDHKVAVWADYSKDKFNAYAEAIWTSGVDYAVQSNVLGDPVIEQKIDSFVTLNTNLSYDITEKAKVSLSGYNLLDQHSETPANYNSLTQVTTGGNTLGRSALVSFKYKF